MEIAAIIISCAIVLYGLLRRKRREQRLDESFLRDELCNEARTKYPAMSLLDALDMLYRDYHDRLIIARSKNEGVGVFIQSRRLIAQERAFLITREQQLDSAFELTHSAQA